MQQLSLKIENATNHIPLETLISFYPGIPEAPAPGEGEESPY